MIRLVYVQSSGELRLDGKVIARGYSGKGSAKNNPARQHELATGPIPRGTWQLAGVRDSKKTGPFAIDLRPLPGTNAQGRTAFQIHGDSVRAPGTASSGCIILPRAIRERIWALPERTIEVIA